MLSGEKDNRRLEVAVTALLVLALLRKMKLRQRQI